MTLFGDYGPSYLGSHDDGSSPNFLVYPLTYDEADKDGANALTRTGPGPALTPQGFQGDGYTTRLKKTSLPAWLASSTAKLSLSAHVTLWRRNANATRDALISIGNDDATANPKLEIVALRDSASGSASLGVRTYDGTAATRYFGKSNWNYGQPWPKAYLTGNSETVRPQGLLFIDADTLLISGHYNDTESRVYRIDLPSGAVTGTFSFGTSTHRHVAAWAERGNGEIWCVDYETDDALQIDLDASFASGSAVILTTWNLSNMGTNVLTGIEFITVSSVEYVMIALYNATTTSFLYVIPTSEISNGATFALANRHKRFVLWRQCQGIALRPDDSLLYLSHNRLSGGANNGVVAVVDIAAAIASLADGGTLTAVREHEGPGQYPEDIKFHPTTGECWVGTEGRESPVDNNGFLAYWRSPLTDNLPVEQHIRIDYDGAGGWEFWLDGYLFNTLSLTPTITPAHISIGGLPAASAGWTNGFALATIRDVALKDRPFTPSELAALAADTYEASSLTAYTVTIANPGAESGTASWTAESGGLGTRSATPSPRYEEGVTNTAYFTGGTSAATLARQRFSLATVTGLSTGTIDTKIAAGDIWAVARWWQANFNGTDDPGSCGIRYLDGTPTTLSTTYSAVTDTDEGLKFMKRSLAVTPDSGSRNIDILQRMDRTSGTNNDSYIDDVELTIYAR